MYSKVPNNCAANLTAVLKLYVDHFFRQMPPILFLCNKYTLNASSNPKDKGPFPEYTLWYNKNDELMKFQFKNWKDNKVVTIVRNNLEKN